MSDLRFSAVWRPGNGRQVVEFGIPFDDFRGVDERRSSDGLRLAAMQVDDTCAAVWRDGSGAQVWGRNMHIEEFKRQDTELFAQGLRLRVLATTNDTDSDDGWYALWHAGSGTQFWATGLSAAEFEARDARFFAQGLRLTWMVHDAGGSETYVGVWRAGTGSLHWWSHEPVDRLLLKDKNSERVAAGEHLFALPNWGLNGIWREASSASAFAFAIPHDEFRQFDQDLFRQGFRIVDFGIGV